MKQKSRAEKWLAKKAKNGFRGYPVGTIAFYGPDNKRASKVAVGIVLSEGAEPEDMEKWFSEDADLRIDPTILAEIMDYLHRWNVHTVVMIDRIIGCPHEEGIDYPEGESCPKCQFWANRDR
jgi:hypothetical protein